MRPKDRLAIIHGGGGGIGEGISLCLAREEDHLVLRVANTVTYPRSSNLSNGSLSTKS